MSDYLRSLEAAMSPTAERTGWSEPQERKGIFYFGTEDAPCMVASPAIEGAQRMRRAILRANDKLARKAIWC